MGSKPAKSYMPLRRQLKLQSNLQELGDLLGSRVLADAILARMLGMPPSALQELQQTLGTIVAYESGRNRSASASSGEWTAYKPSFQGDLASQEAAVI